MVTKWLNPEPRPSPPEPFHYPTGTSFAVIKRQIGKKPPEMRKEEFTPRNTAHNLINTFTKT
jgi:hypothetical protein